MKKYMITFAVIIAIIALVIFTGCKAALPGGSDVAETVIEKAEGPGPEPDVDKETPGQDGESEEAGAEGKVIDDEGEITDTVLGFIEAVKNDEEYGYFSSQTIAVVGSWEEYINGEKSDIYFIIKESHSSWQNIRVTWVDIDGYSAEAEITGDRTAEGMEYEGDRVIFRLIKEDGIWKIDFSS